MDDIESNHWGNIPYGVFCDYGVLLMIRGRGAEFKIMKVVIFLV